MLVDQELEDRFQHWATVLGVPYYPPLGTVYPTLPSEDGRPHYDVRDFGARGDGITDDTVAIQHAVEYAGQVPTGGVLEFPPGQYNYKDIHVPSGITLLGAGIGQTVFKGPGTLYLTNNNVVDGFTIDGGNRSNWAAIKMVNGTNNRVSNNTFLQLQGYAMDWWLVHLYRRIWGDLAQKKNWLTVLRK